jgi:hypothetical protein
MGVEMATLQELTDDAAYFEAALGSRRGVFVTYATTTPESCDAGELAGHGYEDYDEFTPDDDQQMSVDIAIEYLREKGATTPSTSSPQHGVWYSTDFETANYATGLNISYSFHLKNFTPDEETAIFHGITAPRHHHEYSCGCREETKETPRHYDHACATCFRTACKGKCC